MLRTLGPSIALPYSMPVDQSSTFLPGNIAQLTLSGMSVVATLSNGNAPLGIIDDIRTKAFTAVAWDEEVKASVPDAVLSGGRWVTPRDIKVMLVNPNISPDSFVSMNVPCQLIPRNGVVVFPAGTELNIDDEGAGKPTAIHTNVRYTYQIPNIVGDDTTAGSQRVTIWYHKGFYETDVFDTTGTYPLNCNLFVNEKGMLTSKQLTENHPCVALCTSPPNPLLGMLQFVWL